MATRCACESGSTLVFACSGAADVGAVTDWAARELTVENCGKMFCLAGIGGRVPPILEATRAAKRLVALDGCPLDCARQTLAAAGFTPAVHVRVTDLGFNKGKVTDTEPAIARVKEAVRKGVAESA
jgi:uncharacterized metal-binding protein